MVPNPFDFLAPRSPRKAYRTALVYDRACERHASDEAHPERPDRVKGPLKHLRHCGLLRYFVWLGKITPCSRDRLVYAHDESYVDRKLRIMCEYRDFDDSSDAAVPEFVRSRQSAQRYLESSTEHSASVASNSEEDITREWKIGESSESGSDSASSACEGDIYYNEYSHDACLRAAGGAVQAALAIARGDVDNAMCVLRPPGHHAGPRNASGFCIFNNVAIAARALQREAKGIHRVVIFDWDVHHGDGTEKIFYNDPSVLCISIHQYARGHPHRFHQNLLNYTTSNTYRQLTNGKVSGACMDDSIDGHWKGEKRLGGNSMGEEHPNLPNTERLTSALLAKSQRKVTSDEESSGFDDDSASRQEYVDLPATSVDSDDDGYDTHAPDFYPGTGHAENTGTSHGRGRNVNVPLPCHYFGDVEYCAIMQNLLLPMIREFGADFILIAGGFDAVRHDTLGNMKLTPSGYAMMTQMLIEVAPHDRVLCVLEGGYNVPQVSLCVEAVARTLLGAKGRTESRLPLHRAADIVRDVRNVLSSDTSEADALEKSKKHLRMALPDMQLGPFLS
ncbi:histone deacetylase [Perkinsela sp. CCAP 1560/4]|nr:histone deacetylase [Perkinsela sp. CCAP 1560/4]|eukprot:KNH08432.1 histone deacetylase [Perkinsela sp. CCAP 1560/4]